MPLSWPQQMFRLELCPVVRRPVVAWYAAVVCYWFVVFAINYSKHTRKATKTQNAIESAINYVNE
jgi:hypothetical protein